MCDINTKTKKKKVTVFKIAYKTDSEYVSWIAKAPINLGECPDKDEYDKQSRFYNKNMVGRCSGFARLKDIINEVGNDRLWGNTPIILRLELSGNIMRGTAFNIADQIINSSITYAGTHIDSIKELDLNKILKT